MSRGPASTVGRRLAKRGVRWLQPRLGRRVKRTAARFGELAGYDYSYPSLAASLRTLASLGYRAKFAIDVGAYRGEWTSLFCRYFPDAHVLMVEPQQSKSSTLASICAAKPSQLRLYQGLLSDSVEEVAFFEMETGSSMLPELSPWPRTIVHKTTSRLDDVLADHADWGDPDFLKLDVQGAELKVLQGGERALRAATLVLLETTFRPYNEGAPLVGEAIQFMASRGFIPIDVVEEIRDGDGSLFQVDLLFLNKQSEFMHKWASGWPTVASPAQR